MGEVIPIEYLPGRKRKPRLAADVRSYLGRILDTPTLMIVAEGDELNDVGAVSPCI